MSGLRKQAFRVAALVSCLVLLGCGSGSDHGGKDADASSAGGSAAGTGGSSGASGGAKGSSGASSNGGANGSGGAIGAGGSATDGGGIASAPPATCDAPVPLADVSSPGSVVGNGTPDSCTEQALIAAVTKGGVVTFDCGAAAHTITVTSQIDVKKDTVIDGGGKVTLSGSNKTRILHIASAWNVATPLLTVQNLGFVDGFTTDVLNTTATTAGGAAIFEDGGSLTVIDCTFSNNHCASTGEDVSGGAINGQGVGKLVIEGSTFTGNSGSNGGAVGTQAEDVTVVNSVFTNNSATGTDGNPGHGGDGGALSYDGQNNSLTFCGDQFRGNHSNAAGGAIFRVAYNDEPTDIDRSTFDGNSADAKTGNAGALYLEYTAITMTATTLSNNQAHYGGALWVGQSAIANLTNVTVANNNSDQGGALWFASDVTGTFLNCTFAGNTSGYGDALFAVSNGVKLENSIFSNDNCKGTAFVSGGQNLAYDSDGCVSPAASGNPELGALKDNGGATETMAPASGSPADGQGANCPSTDQRGDVRAATGCTLGAVEAP